MKKIIFIIIFNEVIINCSSLFNNNNNNNNNHHQIQQQAVNLNRLTKSEQRVYLSQAHIQFTLDLLSSIVTNEFNLKTKEINSFVFSPLSVQTLLMMLHLGSNGKTKKEIENMLYLNNIDNEHNINGNNLTTTTTANIHDIFGYSIKQLYEDNGLKASLSFSNNIFYSNELRLSLNYERLIKHYYSSILTPIDFNRQEYVLKLINDYIAKQTNGLIKNMLNNNLATSTKLLAINALHYKGIWRYKFDERETEANSWFHTVSGKRINTVDMLVARLPIAYGYNQYLKTAIIELPYRTQQLGLFILLPDQHNGIFHLLRNLNSTSFTTLISSMRKSKNDAINVRLPKFEIESNLMMSNILRNSLGIRSLFTAGEADLSGIFSNVNSVKPNNLDLQISEFLHRAILKIDEHGSIGVAASAAIAERIGSFGGYFFEADRTFMYMLIGKQSGLVLYSGLYTGVK